MKALAFALLCGCSANDDVPAPQVSAVTPDASPPGTIVTVSGAYFCQRPDTGSDDDPDCAVAGTVDFGNVPGTTSDWTDTAIMVEVPSGITGSVEVDVTAQGRTSNGVGFTVQ
ncbi:MAG TPA: IPT/TIG domain-containing protein [Kofleriaceae bacterium]|nr:IPT/TIG domain-containing protein [Kofleriaceae bacterium]